jgi:nitrate/nitrite transport system permease protein
MRQIWLDLGAPVISIVAFLLIWSQVSAGIQTSLGKIPGPAAVWEQTKSLWADHLVQREKAKAFYERQAQRNAEKLAADPSTDMSVRRYTGKPTYIDQIFTSLRTVFAGFLLATIIAVPLGILCGVSKTFNAMFNPLIQLFKPVSPLGLAAHRHDDRERRLRDGGSDFRKVVHQFGGHGHAVLAVADGHQYRGRRGLDRSRPAERRRVLRLKRSTQLTKLVLPSALPYIFHRHAPVARGGLGWC